MPSKLTYEFIKERIESEGYKLLSTAYKNCFTKLKIQNPEGCVYESSWTSFLIKNRYPKGCNKNGALSYSYIKEHIEKEDYKLLTKKYTETKKKLKVQCPEGHIYRVSWTNFSKGNRCPKCKNLTTYNYVKKYIETEGYKLLSKEYKNNVIKLRVCCPEGHNYKVSWGKFLQGRRCPECSLFNRSGNSHYNWKGGIAYEPYCDAWGDKEYKEDIRLRDGYKCLNPDCWGTSDKLCIMHIDNIKKNCHPSNLITGCQSCNTRAMYDEDWWTAWYQAIMYKRYGYTYEVRINGNTRKNEVH